MHTRSVRSAEFGILAVVAGAALAAACGARLDGVGVSTAQGGSAARAPEDAGTQRALFDPNVRASLTAFGRGDATTGHAPGFYSFELFANEAARAALDTGARVFPVGSVLGIDHQHEGRKGPSFFMEKRSVSGDRFGGWRFVAVDGEGHMVDQGQLESCGYCHRDAPVDYVFPALSPMRLADGGGAP